MKILIVGAGGVGGYIGARLIKNSDSLVSFVARGKHLETIKESGLKVIEDDKEYIVYPQNATDDPSKLGIFDIIFITVKATSLDSALDMIESNIDNKSIIIPLLNGVDYDLKIRDRYPYADVMNGCIYIISNIVASGIIRKRGKVFKLCWGKDDFRDIEYQDVITLFNRAFERVEATSDIRLKQWRKFLFISAMAGLTSLYNISMDRVYKEHLDELKEAMREIVEVANALDIPLNQDDINSQLKQASKVIEGAKTSMQLDIQNGAEPELEALIGYVVKRGKSLGVDVVLMEKIYNTLRG